MKEEKPDSQSDTPVSTQPRVADTPIDEKPRSTKAKKMVIESIVALSGVVGIATLWFMVSFTGGPSSIFSNLMGPPDTSSASYIDKKDEAKFSIEKSFASLENSAALKSYGTSSKDACEQGQNNWKVHDGYAHRCTYRTSNFYGISDNLRQHLLDFEQKILKDGWNDSDTPECVHCTISDVIYNYFDNPRQNTSPLYLPPEPAYYTKDGQSLDIMFAHKMLAKDDFFGYYGLGPDNSGQQDFRDGLAAALRDNKYVLVISIQEIFFKN